jgi:hypothetical protein
VVAVYFTCQLSQADQSYYLITSMSIANKS